MNCYKYFKVWLCASVLLIIILAQSACKKGFEQMNTNPNQITEDDLQKDGIGIGGFFQNMQINVVKGTTDPGNPSNYQVSQGLSGDIFSGYMGTPTPFQNNRNNSTYVMTWNDGEFGSGFSVMSGWFEVKKRAQVKMPDFYGVALILKVAKMQRVTDVHGPLPYTRYGIGGFSVAYDSQEAIYNTFFKELDTAINNLTSYVTTNPGATPFKNYDLIYGGDYKKWLKYANSLKLRLAMRIVYANPSLAKQKAEEAVSNANGLIISNTENANLQSANGTTLYNPVYFIQEGYKDIRAGATLESFLVGYNDPRLPAYMLQSEKYPGTYKGIRSGINLGNKDERLGFSKMNLQSNTPLRWMTATEVSFLRAEGALRGWNMGGTAQQFYEAGIDLSFNNAGVGGATYKDDNTSKAAAYVDPLNPANNVALGSPNLSTVTIKWNDADAFERKLERIITQKWLGIFPDGEEAWTEFRRTGYPKVFPVVLNQSGGLVDTQIQIRRLTFPGSEYSNNTVELQKGITLLGGPDTGGTKLWWDKK